jgi:hypothetical protein
VTRISAVVAALGLAACGVPEHGPQMRPGEDCLDCHDGRRAQSWTVAGTLFDSPQASPDAGIEGADVLVTDSAGRMLTLRTNGAGNFYTAEPLTFPLRVEVQGHGTDVGMSMEAPSGSCNVCHTEPPENEAPGRLFLP